MGNVAQPALAMPQIPVAEPQVPAVWSLPLRVAFRFVFCYFVLYGSESGRVNLLDAIPGVSKLGQLVIKGWHTLVPWVAIHMFHLSGRATTYFPTGSGDTTLAYVENLCYLVIALAATIVWSIADCRRQNYRALHGWLRILVRYTLALTMFGYGFAKVFPLQFRYPGFAKLVEPYSDFSPMGVLWSFMGASPAYTIFSGAVEVTGGLLLLFRRTTTLGAMVSAGALVNIVMLNFCYDVPVKLYSANLLLMAVLLMVPDLGRLLNVLVFNRPAPPADLGSLPLNRRWMQMAATGVKMLFIGSILYFQITGGWKSYKQVRNPERPPLYGLYEVETFVQNGHERPPLVTDEVRWRKVMVQFPGFFAVRAMDDSPHSFTSEYAKGSDRVTLFVGGDKSKPNLFTYSRPDPDHVRMEGTLSGDALSIGLRKIDTSKFQLVSRGFHWINELPFNR